MNSWLFSVSGVRRNLQLKFVDDDAIDEVVHLLRGTGWIASWISVNWFSAQRIGTRCHNNPRSEGKLGKRECARITLIVPSYFVLFFWRTWNALCKPFFVNPRYLFASGILFGVRVSINAKMNHGRMNSNLIREKPSWKRLCSRFGFLQVLCVALKYAWNDLVGEAQQVWTSCSGENCSGFGCILFRHRGNSGGRMPIFMSVRARMPFHEGIPDVRVLPV